MILYFGKHKKKFNSNRIIECHHWCQVLRVTIDVNGVSAHFDVCEIPSTAKSLNFELITVDTIGKGACPRIN